MNIVNSQTATTWMVSAALNAGAALWLYKHGHRNWAAFFAVNAGLGVLWATETTKK